MNQDEELYQACRRLIDQKFRSRMAWDDRQDLAWTVYEEALKSIGRGSGPDGPLEPWLYKIARRCFSRWAKGRDRYAAFDEDTHQETPSGRYIDNPEEVWRLLWLVPLLMPARRGAVFAAHLRSSREDLDKRMVLDRKWKGVRGKLLAERLADGSTASQVNGELARGRTDAPGLFGLLFAADGIAACPVATKLFPQLAGRLEDVLTDPANPKVVKGAFKRHVLTACALCGGRFHHALKLGNFSLGPGLVPLALALGEQDDDRRRALAVIITGEPPVAPPAALTAAETISAAETVTATEAAGAAESVTAAGSADAPLVRAAGALSRVPALATNVLGRVMGSPMMTVVTGAADGLPSALRPIAGAAIVLAVLLGVTATTAIPSGPDTAAPPPAIFPTLTPDDPGPGGANPSTPDSPIATVQPSTVETTPPPPSDPPPAPPAGQPAAPVVPAAAPQSPCTSADDLAQLPPLPAGPALPGSDQPPPVPAGVSFPIHLDASQLFFRYYIIPGVTPNWTDKQAVSDINFAPGVYAYQIGSGQIPDFVFTVTSAGLIDYVAADDTFLSGRGTSTLVIRGFPIRIDATRLTGQGILLPSSPSEGEPNAGWITDQTVWLLPAQNYSTLQGPAMTGNFIFDIGLDGLVHYNSAFSGFVSGDGTTTMTLRGYDLCVDARPLNPAYMSVQTVYQAFDKPPLQLVHLMPTPGYGLDLGLPAGITGCAGFNVGIDGTITVAAPFTAGAHMTQTSTTPLLTVDSMAACL
jgi:hypothetical protein